MTLALMVLSCCNVNATSNSTSEALNQVQNDKKQLQSKIDDLNTQIDKVIKDISNNKDAMNKIAENIKVTESKLEDTKNKSEAENKLFRSRIRAMYINGNDAYLNVILSSESLSDFISRIDTITKIMQYDDKIITQLKQNEQTIENEKQTLYSENNKLQALKTNNETTLSKLNDTIKEQKELLATTVEKEQQLQAQQLQEQQYAQAFSASNSLDGQTLSRGGAPVSFSQVLSVNATAYCNDSVTACGTCTIRNPNGYSTIAVDPRVIPLGSKVYVDGYGYAIADDIGGAIKGNRIDLFMNSESDAENWGIRSVNVYILN